MSAPVEVIEADREAAWPFAGFHCLPDRQMRERWFSGWYDNLERGAVIHAFARHRLNTTVPDEVVKALEAAQTNLLGWAVHMSTDHPGDVEEDCGWWCGICKDHVDGDRQTGPSKDGHAADCAIALVTTALQTIKGNGQ